MTGVVEDGAKVAVTAVTDTTTDVTIDEVVVTAVTNMTTDVEAVVTDMTTDVEAETPDAEIPVDADSITSFWFIGLSLMH